MSGAATPQFLLGLGRAGFPLLPELYAYATVVLGFVLLAPFPGNFLIFLEARMSIFGVDNCELGGERDRLHVRDDSSELGERQ